MSTGRQSARLQERKSLQEILPQPPPAPQERKRRKTNAEACRDYKKRMKENDPEKWEMTKESNRQYSKAYRASLTQDKGPSDGESAVVKSGAARAVKGGRVTISNAQELFQFLQSSALNKQPDEAQPPPADQQAEAPPAQADQQAEAPPAPANQQAEAPPAPANQQAEAAQQDLQPESCHHSQHSLRTFFYVQEEDVSRTRDRPALPVVGCQKLHSVRGVEGSILMTRALSCFCDPCRAGVGDCETVVKTGRWEIHDAGRQKTGRRKQKERTPAEAPPPAEAQPPPAQANQPDAPQPLAVGDFASINVPVAGRNKSHAAFYAKVLTIDNQDLHVKYLVEQKPGQYVWADEAWVDAADIVCKVPPPTLAPGRGISFIFE